jgi:hypothetical protein
MDKIFESEYRVVGWGCTEGAICWHPGCTNKPTCYITRWGLQEWDPSCNDHVPENAQGAIAKLLLKAAEKLPMPK